MVKFLIIISSVLWINSYDLAIEENGIKETGFNRGRCELYLKSVGLNAGNPYCMAGIYWSFDSIAKKYNIKNPLYKTGSTIRFADHYKKDGVKTEFTIEKYDIGILRLGEQYKGHAFRIDSVYRGGVVRTFEFNTGINAREGEGNTYKIRNLLSPISAMHLYGLFSNLKTNYYKCNLK